MENNKENIISHIKSLKTSKNTQELISYIQSLLQSISESKETFQNDGVFLANVYNELALGYLHNFETEKAEQALCTAYEICNSNVNVLRNLANIYYQKSDFTNALKYLLETIALLPENAETQYHAGICLSSLGKPEEALPYFLNTCENSPDFPGGFYWAGQCLLHKENFTEALEKFEKAYELEKENEGLLRSMAVCCYNLKQYHKAIETADALSALIGPDQVFSYKIKGDAFLALGEVQEAVKNHVILASVERELEAYPLNVIKQMQAEESPYLNKYIKYISVLLPEFSEEYSKYLNS